jgi:hypothetical protein
MNYLLAILLPPLSILLAGRPIMGVLSFLFWVPAVIFSGRPGPSLLRGAGLDRHLRGAQPGPSRAAVSPS